MLKPCVGRTCDRSSLPSCRRIVVLPALSRPSTRILQSSSFFFSFCSICMRPGMVGAAPARARWRRRRCDGESVLCESSTLRGNFVLEQLAKDLPQASMAGRNQASMAGVRERYSCQSALLVLLAATASAGSSRRSRCWLNVHGFAHSGTGVLRQHLAAMPSSYVQHVRRKGSVLRHVSYVEDESMHAHCDPLPV